MPYDAVVFDFDGVIMDLPGDSFAEHLDAVTGRTLDRIGIDESHEDYDAFAEAIRSRDTDRIRELAGLHDQDYEKIWRTKEAVSFERQRTQIASGDRMFYDDIVAIPELAGHCTIGVFSNNQHALIDYALQREAPPLNGAGALDTVITTYYGIQPDIADHDNRKPEPTYISTLQEELGADELLYVGDKPIDITAAHRAGADSAFIRRPYHGDLDGPPTDADGYEPAYALESLHDLVPIVADSQEY
jgi:phosphoglycolate phosphatase-like HAD superfamily hydrolase